MARFKISASYFDALDRDLLNWVNESLGVLKQEIDARTPEDSKTLLGNNKLNRASKVWGVIQWSISNDTEYWLFVEFGVLGNKYKYNKPKGSIFYSGVGARMFTRGFDATKNRIISILKRWW